MKQFLSIITMILFSLSIAAPVAAATPTPTTATAEETPVPTAPKNQQIEDLKERLATKVAELQQSQRRALFGTVKTVSISSFTIETEKKDVKIELTDEIKVFQFLKGKRTTLKTENVEKGDVVTVFGNYDTTIDVMEAKVIFIQSAQVILLSGTISETSKKDYTITVNGWNGKTHIVDFETTTKTFVWNGKEQEKGGFSKLVAGDTIAVAGTLVANKENRVSALRILTLGNPNGTPPAATTPTATDAKSTTPSATPKLTPTVKP